MATAKVTKKRRRPRVHRSWRRTTISPHTWLDVLVAALRGGAGKAEAVETADHAMNSMAERFDEDGCARIEDWKPYS